MRYAWLIWIGYVLQLLIWGPQYEPDIHYYLSGALHWDGQHPPGTNIFLSLCYHLYPSAYLPVLLQTLAYSFAITWLFVRVLRLHPLWLLLPALEPATAFYLLSLQSEGLFMSAVVVLGGFLLQNRAHWQLGVALGVAFLFRYQTLFLVPVTLLLVFIRRKEIPWSTLLVFVAVFIAEKVGHAILDHAATFGKTQWDNAAAFYEPEEELNIQDTSDWHIPRKRYAAGRYAYIQLSARHGQAYADSVFRRVADSLYNEHGTFVIQGQLIWDNVKALGMRPYLYYQHLPHYYPNMRQEYEELDAMMLRLYDYKAAQPTHEIWLYPRVYFALLFVGLLGLLLWRGRNGTLIWLAMGASIPMLLMLPVQARFFVAYLPIVLAWAARYLWGRDT